MSQLFLRFSDFYCSTDVAEHSRSQRSRALRSSTCTQQVSPVGQWPAKIMICWNHWMKLTPIQIFDSFTSSLIPKADVSLVTLFCSPALLLCEECPAMFPHLRHDAPRRLHLPCLKSRHLSQSVLWVQANRGVILLLVGGADRHSAFCRPGGGAAGRWAAIRL